MVGRVNCFLDVPLDSRIYILAKPKFYFQHFGKQLISKDVLNDIIQSAIIYTLDFDLLTPPYNTVQEITVLEKIQQAGLTAIKTGKRMGFRFNAKSSDS